MPSKNKELSKLDEERLEIDLDKYVWKAQDNRNYDPVIYRMYLGEVFWEAHNKKLLGSTAKWFFTHVGDQTVISFQVYAQVAEEVEAEIMDLWDEEGCQDLDFEDVVMEWLKSQ